MLKWISLRLLKILFEDFPTLSNHTEPLLDNFCILPLEEGIQGQRFYIPSLHEVLCVENSSDMTQLRTAAECGYWGSMKNIDVHAMRYDHKHKRMRWVIFGYLDGGTHTNLPYLPADLIAGMCNGEKLNLPPWANKLQNQVMSDLKIRLILCSGMIGINLFVIKGYLCFGAVSLHLYQRLYQN